MDTTGEDVIMVKTDVDPHASSIFHPRDATTFRVSVQTALADEYCTNGLATVNPDIFNRRNRRDAYAYTVRCMACGWRSRALMPSRCASAATFRQTRLLSSSISSQCIDQAECISAPVQRFCAAIPAIFRVNSKGCGMAPITSAPKRTASSNSALHRWDKTEYLLASDDLQVYPRRNITLHFQHGFQRGDVGSETSTRGTICTGCR